jgi:transcriptional regulator with XRE-family HTH domain
MAARDSRAERGARLARRSLIENGELAREARIRLGLTQEAVGARVGCSRTAIWRIERGDSQTRVDDLWRVMTVLGFEVSLRAFPAGDPVRDRGQIVLMARLRARLHPSLTWATEVPLPIERDQRAWDALITGPGFRIGVEAESRLRDAQATLRRIALKSRDGGVDHAILLLAETRANTASLAGARAYLAGQLPLDTRQLLAALARGRDPGGSGIAVLGA